MDLIVNVDDEMLYITKETGELGVATTQSPFKADPYKFDTDVLDLYLMVATLPSVTDRPAKYKYVGDDPYTKNEQIIDWSELSKDSEIDADHVPEQVIWLAQSTEVDENVILYKFRLLEEAEALPITKNWLFDTIRCPFPL